MSDCFYAKHVVAPFHRLNLSKRSRDIVLEFRTAIINYMDTTANIFKNKNRRRSGGIPLVVLYSTYE